MGKSNDIMFIFSPLSSVFWVEIKVRTTPGLDRQNLPCEQNKLKGRKRYWISKRKNEGKMEQQQLLLSGIKLNKKKNAMLSLLRKIYIAPTIKNNINSAKRSFSKVENVTTPSR